MGLIERLRATATILEAQADLASRIAASYAPEREAWEASKGDDRLTVMIQYQLDQKQLARSLRKDAKEATDAAAALEKLLGYAHHADTCPWYLAWNRDKSCTCGLTALLKELNDD